VQHGIAAITLEYMFSLGEGQFGAHSKSETLEPTGTELVTTDNIGEDTRHAKIGNNRRRGSARSFPLFIILVYFSARRPVKFS
jgi:hypothetical protein